VRSIGSKQERRRHPRAITSFSVVLTAGARQYAARVINLSMGGALLDFSKIAPDPAIEVGDRLTIEIRCRGSAGPVAFEGAAVLWNLKSSSEPLLAVQFDEVTGEGAEILEDLLIEALAEIKGRRDVMSRA
jgi:PilZ domain